MKVTPQVRPLMQRTRKQYDPMSPLPIKTKLGYSGFIILELQDNSIAPGNDDLRERARDKLPQLANLLTDRPEVKTRRLIYNIDEDTLRRMEEEAALTEFPPLSSLTSYWRLDCRNLNSPLLKFLKELRETEGVEHAYREKTATPPTINIADDDHAAEQRYLGSPNNGGINALWAWTQPNGVGADVGFVDIEQAWNVNHEDLKDKRPELIFNHNLTSNRALQDHGTAVLGEVVGVDNGIGIVGVAPGVTSIKLASHFNTHDNSAGNIAAAIAEAVSRSNEGDVILLEVQKNFFPIEIEDADFNAIRLASAQGRIVIEPAGNGNLNLDLAFRTSDGEVIDRLAVLNDQTCDSGAIMVGACCSTSPFNRFATSNHGARLDCFAWGENITTTGFGDLEPTLDEDGPYTKTFGGTSGASAIVAGAALLLQGMYKANNPAPHTPLTPTQMRALLSSRYTCTWQGSTVEGFIGFMPDLHKISDSIARVPDVYLRDSLDVTTATSITESPDIIVTNTRVADGNVVFAEASHTANSDSLNSDLIVGQDNFIYLRIRNRSNSIAPAVNATVYWIEPGTTVNLDQSHLVGHTTVENVPNNNSIVVTNPIIFPASSLPATGSYVLAVFLGPVPGFAPRLPFSMTWSEFVDFVRSNNNVACRAVEVVDALVPAN